MSRWYMYEVELEVFLFGRSFVRRYVSTVTVYLHGCLNIEIKFSKTKIANTWIIFVKGTYSNGQIYFTPLQNVIRGWKYIS